MPLSCFCKEPGRRIHCMQMPEASLWWGLEGAGSPKPCVHLWLSQGSERAFSKLCWRKRIDRSLVTVMAVGAIGNIVPAIAEGLSAVLPGESCVKLVTVAATGAACEGPEEGWPCRGGCVSHHICAEQPLLHQGLSSACLQRPGKQELWVEGNWTYDWIKINSLGRKCFEIMVKRILNGNAVSFSLETQEAF